MRQGNSRQLFVHMLKTMLKGRGIHVNKLQLEKFFLFVEEVCPWFPEEGTVSLETWKKVGKQLQTYYSLHGPNRATERQIQILHQFSSVAQSCPTLCDPMQCGTP